MSKRSSPILPRIYADFNNADPLGRLRLNCKGTLDDLEKTNIQFREGLKLTFYMEDVECDGVATLSSEENIWVGQIDWNKIKHL